MFIQFDTFIIPNIYSVPYHRFFLSFGDNILTKCNSDNRLPNKPINKGF